MQKKIFKFSLFVIAFLMLGSIFGSYQVRAEEKKTFTVGFDAAFPPYGFKNAGGEYVGFDLDLAQEVCNRRGWILKKQPIDWDAKDMELKSNTIDCIWNGFTINGREDKYTWTKPYVDNSQVVLVSKENNIKKLSDLKGKIVVVQADSSAKEALTGDDATKANKELAASFSKMQEVADYNSAVMNLESGAVDAICMDIGVAKFQTGKHKSLTILEERISSEGYGVGFLKGNTKLRDQVQETLYEMAEDGTVDRIAQKYADYNLPECVCIGKKTQTNNTSEQKEAKEESDTDNVSDEQQVGFIGKMKQGFANFGEITKQLCSGFGATLSIFFLTMIISLPLGLLVAFGRMTKITPIRWFTKVYISIMRGTPLMLQLLVVFFGPYYLFGVKLASTVPHYRFISVIIGFSLNYAAYFAEIYRSGIESIPVGQREAAKLLGYTRAQTFGKIILPQMMKRVMPPVTNEIITLVKDTSLAFVLSYMEMFTMAQQIAATMTNVIPIFVAGVFYYVFNYFVAFVMELIEKKLNYYQ